MKVNIVFDGPPGPIPGRFVEVEDDLGRSVGVGEWIEWKQRRPSGTFRNWWALRIEVPDETVTRSRQRGKP